MKQILKSFNPKQILRFRKSRSVSKSEPASFGSASSSSSDDSSSLHKPRRAATLPARACSDDWTSDRDADGKITFVELESLLRRVGPVSEEELADMMKEIDRDEDGCVCIKELEKVGAVLEGAGAGEDDLRETFDFFDADHDGRITAKELHAVFRSLGDERCTLEECQRMIEGVDKNKDGFVCFEDFARMMDLQR